MGQKKDGTFREGQDGELLVDYTLGPKQNGTLLVPEPPRAPIDPLLDRGGSIPPEKGKSVSLTYAIKAIGKKKSPPCVTDLPIFFRAGWNSGGLQKKNVIKNLH